MPQREPSRLFGLREHLSISRAPYEREPVRVPIPGLAVNRQAPVVSRPLRGRRPSDQTEKQGRSRECARRGCPILKPTLHERTVFVFQIAGPHRPAPSIIGIRHDVLLAYSHASAKVAVPPERVRTAFGPGVQSRRGVARRFVRRADLTCSRALRTRPGAAENTLDRGVILTFASGQLVSICLRYRSTVRV